jgi:hypothetical protein
MTGAIPPLPQYAFMAWCLVKAQGQLLSEGRTPHGRPRHRWEDNVGMYHQGIVWEGMDWVHVTQDRDQLQAVVNMVKNQRTCGFYKMQEFFTI